MLRLFINLNHVIIISCYYSIPKILTSNNRIKIILCYIKIILLQQRATVFKMYINTKKKILMNHIYERKQCQRMYI